MMGSYEKHPYFVYTFLIILLCQARSLNSGSGQHETRLIARSPPVPGESGKSEAIIGFLLPIHEKPPDSQAELARRCSSVIQEQYGIQRVEVIMKTIDEINAKRDLLPNVTLGYEIRDTCWFKQIALEQSIQFLREKSRAHQLQEGIDPQCQQDAEREAPIIGVIGPSSSSIAIAVQNLLQLFEIPQIGYSTTSVELSSINLYQTFMRVVPSDMLQAQAIISLLQRFGWSYVYTLHTEGSYGLNGIQAFQDQAMAVGICRALDQSLPTNAVQSDYNSVVQQFLSAYEHTTGQKKTQVIVCFCEGETITGLLRALARADRKNFVVIGSDGWADRDNIVQNDTHDTAVGTFSLKVYSRRLESFDKYFQALNPANNSRNPWFSMYWQQLFECRLAGDPQEDVKKSRYCTGKESLADGDAVNQDPKLALLVKAIYVLAHGLDQMHGDLCHNDPPNAWCTRFDEKGLNKTLFDYMKEVKLQDEEEVVSFDANGDPSGSYLILNYQRDPVTGDYLYREVGFWKQAYDSFHFDLDESLIQWGDKQGAVAQCSTPCRNGYSKKVTKDICCWTCIKCDDNEIVTPETGDNCEACPRGFWPTVNQTDCFKLTLVYRHWIDPLAILGASCATLGILATIFVLIEFMRYHDTPVVKSASRELCYILLMGLLCSYTTTFIYLAKPTDLICYLQRIMLPLSLTICYSALVMKTNRIARILAGSKKKICVRKPRFMSGSAQVIISLSLVAIEVVIIITFLRLDPPGAMEYFPEVDQAFLICRSSKDSFLGTLAYVCVLVIMCTYYAFKTRNVPANFNEAKFVAFLMYSTCILMIGFVPLYLADNQFKTIATCYNVILCASVTLLCMFVPKLYIIICKPETNNRSRFVTNPELRIHIGGHVSGTGPKRIQKITSASPGPTVVKHQSNSVSVMGDAMPEKRAIKERLEEAGPLDEDIKKQLMFPCDNLRND